MSSVAFHFGLLLSMNIYLRKCCCFGVLGWWRVGGEILFLRVDERKEGIKNKRKKRKEKKEKKEAIKGRMDKTIKNDKLRTAPMQNQMYGWTA